VAKDTRVVVPLKSSAPSEAKASETLARRSPEQLAVQIARVMDLIAARLELEPPQPSKARRVRGARTVPRDFVMSMLAAAERNPDHRVLSKFDTARARAVMQSADAYRAVAEHTAMFLASLNYTIEVQWAEVVANAMRTFTMASVVAEVSDDAGLAAEVENLRRKLGRKGLRKKKAKKDPDGK